NGAEYFERADLRIARWIVQHGACVTRVGDSLAAAQHFRAAILRLAYPLLDAIDFGSRDEWTDFRVRTRRIAHTKPLHTICKLVGELLRDRAMREDSLNRNAHLPGMIERALH